MSSTTKKPMKKSTKATPPPTITMPAPAKPTTMAKAPRPALDPIYLTTASKHFGPDAVALLRDAIYPHLTLAEIGHLLHVAIATGLDPISKQIIGVKKWDRVYKQETFALITKIDGFRAIAERSGRYAGQRGPWFTDGKPILDAAGVPVFDADGAVRVAWKTIWDSPTPPFAARVDVYREGFDAPISSPALWSEYADPDSPMWSPDGFPTVMLAKCSEALSLRRAFPNELAGLHIVEEMKREGTTIDTHANFVDGLAAEHEAKEKAKEEKAASVLDDGAVAATGSPVVDLLTGRGRHAQTRGKKTTALLIGYRGALDACEDLAGVEACAEQWAPQWVGADKVLPLANALKLDRAAQLGGPEVPSTIAPLLKSLHALQVPKAPPPPTTPTVDAAAEAVADTPAL